MANLPVVTQKICYLAEVTVTRQKIKNNIIACLLGPSQIAAVSRIALDTMVPAVGDHLEFVQELAHECGCSVTEWEDRGFIFRMLTSHRRPLPRLDKARKSSFVYFTPDEIQSAMDKNLATGLRQLADALDAGAIEGKCIDCKGHGFGPKDDSRAHLLLRIDLAAPIKQVFLEGESRQEFERDRIGQTGEEG